MMQHLVSKKQQEPKFVHILSEIHTFGSTRMILQLPAWRPGRYELGNFAKNVKGFTVVDAAQRNLTFKKLTKDAWEIDCEGLDKVWVSYYYYAQQPDAGACYVNDDLIYLNPVHCFMYVQGRIDEPHKVTFDVPENWQLACQLPQEGKALLATNFDALADSPVFVSPNLYHHAFTESNTQFHFWFYGAAYPLLDKLTEDTKVYANWQTQLFGELPCKDYHFLYK
jgi:predicted metalloprotease with PDZ domain